MLEAVHGVDRDARSGNGAGLTVDQVEDVDEGLGETFGAVGVVNIFSASGHSYLAHIFYFVGICTHAKGNLPRLDGLFASWAVTLQILSKIPLTGKASSFGVGAVETAGSGARPPGDVIHTCIIGILSRSTVCHDDNVVTFTLISHVDGRIIRGAAYIAPLAACAAGPGLDALSAYVHSQGRLIFQSFAALGIVGDRHAQHIPGRF